jgi:hypothetical protein
MEGVNHGSKQRSLSCTIEESRMELIIFGVFIIGSVMLGYRMGRGDELKINVAKLKAVVRTGDQTDEVIERQSRKLDDRYHKRVTNG